MAVPVYGGQFSEREAARLLWRAGFGPKPGEAAKLAQKGLSKAVDSLLNPPKAKLIGPEPTDSDGYPLSPYDLYGHDALWWLDKMIRSNQPLVERMALNWHDWFATGDVSSAKFSIGQAKLFRKRALSPFDQLLRDVTIDKAMLVWLSGIENNKWNPNENYGREVMELFTLGVSDETGYPYSEDDVREQARALTGWRADWDDDVGLVNFRYDPKYHDYGVKTVFGQSGKFTWEDTCRLCLEHEAHAPYMIERLWKYFVPDPIPTSTLDTLVATYRKNYALKPVIKAILKSPEFYTGSAMVKPPVVYIAGLLRGRGRGIDRDSWTGISDMAGQRLFLPPNVAGWDEERWLDTSSYRGRWHAVAEITRDDQADPDDYSKTETPAEAVDKALMFWGDPIIESSTRTALEGFASDVEGAIHAPSQKGYFRGLRQNAMRLLVATSHDMQTC
jgi:uncharacterized protein (DUF1800 family)